MKKLCFLLCLILLPGMLLAQSKSPVQLTSYTVINGVPKQDLVRLGKPTFRQDNAILSADSAHFYQERNVFEAFGNVHINQADTVNIFSDRLHYDGNKKQAHLTNNVRLVQRESVLTTNVLDYNMVSKIGTYTNGGKIVNKDVTVTSRNGYYFAASNDSYFRYNVLVKTPQSTITSDTMRYNTQSKWTYFYGPTNIKGKDDNLYTENGLYNTLTEKAFFGKKNLYKNGSKSLKGDSLTWDGRLGYGKAMGNIFFRDTTDKTLLRGEVGEYFKKTERTLVTKNAYFGIETSDSVKTGNKMTLDSLWMGADTLETQMVLQKTLRLLPKISVRANNELDFEERGEETLPDSTANVPAAPAAGQAEAAVQAAVVAAANEKKTATPVKETAAERRRKRRAEKSGETAVSPPPNQGREKIATAQADSLKLANAVADSAGIAKKTDSLVRKGGTFKTDSLVKRADTRTKAEIRKAGRATKAVATAARPAVKPKVTTPASPLDTLRTRVISAYHNVRVYKSDIQAKADSLFYTSADSTLRCFQNPILWSQGSQQTGDTINIQFVNKKINSVQVIQSAFLVNTPQDSLKFNQIKGKVLTGFFNKGKLNTLFVDGNAESIYYTQDDSTKAYKEMNQTVGSRLKISFLDNEINKIVNIKKPEGVLYPAEDLPKEPFLKGFIWKPEDRPRSKFDAIRPRKKTVAKAAAAKKPAAKNIAKKTVATNIPTPKKTVTTPVAQQPAANRTQGQTGSTADTLTRRRLPNLIPDTTGRTEPPIVRPGNVIRKQADSVRRRNQ
ncbi:OstA-like protein [Pedobacter sp. SYP-B3415]|uniref:OstA-like protein n=1 Tax=Pedobacter sp. SYP-B3415 TaxID=2496641 RepID=UPI001F102863|nr:OstA-like protein [Pedobacter sp. SYP-B3415]